MDKKTQMKLVRENHRMKMQAINKDRYIAHLEAQLVKAENILYYTQCSTFPDGSLSNVLKVLS